MQVIRGEDRCNIRFDLADHTANILTAMDRTRIFTSSDVAAISADDTTEVIADVGITHRTGVAAAHNDSCRITGNAAGVAGCRAGIHVREAVYVHGEVHIDLHGVNGRIDAFCVDLHGIAAGLNQAGVISSDAAGGFFSHKSAVGTAASDSATIRACNAADIFNTFHGSGKGNIFEGTAVVANDAANKFSITGRHGSTCNIQVLHNRRGLQIAEQTCRHHAVCNRKTADGVSVSLKAAAKSGNGKKIRTRKGNVGIQNELFIL